MNSVRAGGEYPAVVGHRSIVGEKLDTTRCVLVMHTTMCIVPRNAWRMGDALGDLWWQLVDHGFQTTSIVPPITNSIQVD